MTTQTELALPAALCCSPADAVPANAAGRSITKGMGNARLSGNSRRQLVTQTRFNILTTAVVLHSHAVP